MHPIDNIDFIIAREHYKELLQEAEQERLIRAAGFRQPANRDWFWHITGVVVDWLWKWGGSSTLWPTQSAFSAVINSPITT